MVQKVKNTERAGSNPQLILAGIIVAAVVVAVVAIGISSSGFNPAAIKIDYSQIHQGRTADGGFILGDSNAPVTVIAFEDFICPHCQDYQPTILRFIKEYVATGKARFEYRFLPAVHPTYSVLSAQLTECSEILKPGSFWDAHDLMFELAASERFSDTTPRKFADLMGLEYGDVLQCTGTADQIRTDMQYGDNLGVTGTPTLFIQYGDGIPQRTPPQPSFEQLTALIAVQQ